jgi:UDP-2,4-diacetamido-2,4,6-trideoxy-beta-L-altropyranose hydrolase
MDRLRVAFRADGDERIGAGHVARCLPLAVALRGLGHAPTFVGAFGGLAAWLLERASIPTATPAIGAPAGVELARFDAAVVDSYAIEEGEICRLAAIRPVATLGEARRCSDAGVVIDYHADRAGEAATARCLPGPAYAPIDPAFLGARQPRATVRRALVTVGGGQAGLRVVAAAIAALREVFPGVTLVLASGAEAIGDDIERLSFPSSLAEVVDRIDLAVSAAGLTAYELACAGVPAVLVAVADNQRRVTSACAAAGIALTVDAVDDDAAEQLAAAVLAMRDPALRERLATRGMELVDGRGAERAADALLERWVGSIEPPAR